MRPNLNLHLEARTIQSLAVEKLRGLIVSGEFSPGMKLVEADLCQMLGISRPSLREALRTLESERLVTIVPNRGPHISVLTWEEARQIYHVRSLLEGDAARTAAVNASKQDIAMMEKALHDFDSCLKTDDRRSEVETTQRFYEALLASSGNKIIEEILMTLLARISILRAHSMSAPGRATKSSAEMWAILEAIKRRDPAEAQAAAIQHVMNACASAKSVFTDSHRSKTA